METVTTQATAVVVAKATLTVTAGTARRHHCQTYSRLVLDLVRELVPEEVGNLDAMFVQFADDARTSRRGASACCRIVGLRHQEK